MKRIIAVSICLAFVLSASTILLPQPITFPQFQQRVRSLITARNGALNALFRAQNYRSMPEQLKYRTKIVTHEGDIIEGEDSENYWTEIGAMGARELNFEDPQLTFLELEVSTPPQDNEIDYVAVEVTVFTFTIDGTLHRGFLDPIYKHRVRCTIDD